MARKKQRVDTSGQGGDGFSTLGGAFAGLGFAATSSPEPEVAAPPEPDEALDPGNLSAVRKVVLRLEKKGRRGKAVTLIEGLPENLVEVMARDLKRTLGCGVSCEGTALVVQGDQRDRLEPLFRERGVSKVSR